MSSTSLLSRGSVICLLLVVGLGLDVQTGLAREESDSASLPIPISTVKLEKQYVPVRRGDRVVAHKTAFFGTVSVGAPSAQNFTVVFDTGSGHFFLPSKGCTSTACATHRQYDRDTSKSAIDIDHDGAIIDPRVDERDQVAIAFGTGEIAGEFVKEVLCLGGPVASREASKSRHDCVSLRLIMASEMTPDPFESFAFDGVIGLGLDALSLHPEFNFFAQLSRQGLIASPRFGVFLANSDEDDSEISFGGHDSRRVKEPLRWAPVARPDLGYWQVQLKSVTVGDEILPLCQEEGGCQAIVDTGTSLLGVPKQITSSMHWLLARQLSGSEEESMDCRKVTGPTVTFDLGDFTLELDAEDYSRPAPMSVKAEDGEAFQFCRASLLPVAMEEPLSSRLFIWGEPVLRKYYTAYDYHMKQVGFAKAKHSVLGPPPALELVATPTVQV